MKCVDITRVCIGTRSAKVSVKREAEESESANSFNEFFVRSAVQFSYWMAGWAALILWPHACLVLFALFRNSLLKNFRNGLKPSFRSLLNSFLGPGNCGPIFQIYFLKWRTFADNFQFKNGCSIYLATRLVDWWEFHVERRGIRSGGNFGHRSTANCSPKLDSRILSFLLCYFHLFPSYPLPFSCIPPATPNSFELYRLNVCWVIQFLFVELLFSLVFFQFKERTLLSMKKEASLAWSKCHHLRRTSLDGDDHRSGSERLS